MKSIKKHEKFYIKDIEVGKADIYIYPNDEVWFGNLTIKTKFRGNGYGTLFVKKLIKKYNINNCIVVADNIPAIKVYKKCGFKKYKQYKSKDFNNKEVIWMKR